MKSKTCPNLQENRVLECCCSWNNLFNSLILALYRTVWCKDIDLPDSLPPRKNFKEWRWQYIWMWSHFNGCDGEGWEQLPGRRWQWFPRSRLWDEAGLGVQMGPPAARRCQLRRSLLARFLGSWGFGLPCAPTPAWPSGCSHDVALAWELRLTGSTDWPPLAYSNVCVHFRKEVCSWRRIKVFPLQRTLTTNFCTKSRYQISHAQPRIQQSQDLSGSTILYPFNRISRTQAGGRDGSIPAIPELQVLGNWDFSREEKGTVKQQFWRSLSAFDPFYFYFFSVPEFLK